MFWRDEPLSRVLSIAQIFSLTKRDSHLCPTPGHHEGLVCVGRCGGRVAGYDRHGQQHNESTREDGRVLHRPNDGLVRRNRVLLHGCGPQWGEGPRTRLRVRRWHWRVCVCSASSRALARLRTANLGGASQELDDLCMRMSYMPGCT